MPNNAIPYTACRCTRQRMHRLVLAIMPVYILMQAIIPARIKISAGVVLLLGCTSGVMSLIRIRYVKGLLPDHNFFDTSIDL